MRNLLLGMLFLLIGLVLYRYTVLEERLARWERRTQAIEAQYTKDHKGQLTITKFEAWNSMFRRGKGP